MVSVTVFFSAAFLPLELHPDRTAAPSTVAVSMTNICFFHYYRVSSCISFLYLLYLKKENRFI